MTEKDNNVSLMPWLHAPIFSSEVLSDVVESSET